MGCVLSAICCPFLPCLHCIGFTASGIAKGSGAACYQAGVGLVAAGSCFAKCQSVAAGSSICGCLSVALSWVIILGALLLWIFGYFNASSTDAFLEGLFGNRNSTTPSVFNTTNTTFDLTTTNLSSIQSSSNYSVYIPR